MTEKPISYAGPTGREKPGEHWNARIIREQQEAEQAAESRVTPAQGIIDEPFAIIADHLVAHVGRCTCDGLFETYGHRPECGYEPVMTLDELSVVLAKAGRAVVDLPEPEKRRGSNGETYWFTSASSITVGLNLANQPFLRIDGILQIFTDVEADALARLAAVREARRLAVSPKGGETND